MDKPIRIAQIMGKFKAGGVEMVVFNYYRAIDKNKIQFDFYYDADSTVEPPQELIEMGARFIKVSPYQHLPSYLSALKKHFKENNYQIVHSHINTLSVFPLYMAWRCGIPVRIAHNHSTAGKGETKKNIMKYMLRPLAKIFPTQLCACSQYAGEWIYGKGTRFRVINNAIDLEKYKYDVNRRNELRQELGLEGKKVIGHIGRFCYQKNHDLLIDIFNEVLKIEKNAVLMLIGEGELEGDIKRKVKKLGIENNVLFLGRRADTYRYYQAMDLFLLPSRYEGLPVVGVEAQACGLACVFSSVVTPETKLLNSTVFVDGGIDEYTKKVVEGLRLARKDTSLEMAEAGYDIKTGAKKLLEFYEEIL